VSPLPLGLPLAEAVNRVGIAGYGDHWVARIERTHYAVLQYIMAVSWLKRHGFDTEAGALVDRERLEAMLAAHPPNWEVHERRAPDFKVGIEHTVFEWCMFYTYTQPNLVPIYTGTTVDDMNTRLRAIGARPVTPLPNLRLWSAPDPGGKQSDPRSRIRNEVFRTIQAEIGADRIIPLKLAYCSDQPARFDLTMCVIAIAPVLEIARSRKDFGPTMAKLLTAHDGASSGRTGAPGRPSKGMHTIQAEFERRIRNNGFKLDLREEATELLAWYHVEHPSEPQPTVKTIANRLRGAHRQEVNRRRSGEA
jgi:hypothetical protein